MSDVNILNEIIAMIVLKNSKDNVNNGSIPTFYTDTEEEREKIAMYLSRITKGMVHDLENGVYIIVKH